MESFTNAMKPFADHLSALPQTLNVRLSTLPLVPKEYSAVPQAALTIIGLIFVVSALWTAARAFFVHFLRPGHLLKLYGLGIVKVYLSKGKLVRVSRTCARTHQVSASTIREPTDRQRTHARTSARVRTHKHTYTQVDKKKTNPKAHAQTRSHTLTHERARGGCGEREGERETIFLTNIFRHTQLFRYPRVLFEPDDELGVRDLPV